MSIGQFLINIIPSSISCFFGLKLQKLVLCIIWFVLGFYFGGFICDCLAIQGTVPLIIQIVIGLVLGLLSFKIQKLSFFLALFAFGFLLVYAQTAHIWYNYIIGGVVGLILGLLAFKFFEPMLIISTSVTGGYNIADAICDVAKFNNNIILVVIAVVVIAAGLYVQFSSFQKEKVTKG